MNKKIQDKDSTSYFEYLVRNPVHKAYQLDLILQDLQCVLYKVCGVNCTKCAVRIVKGVRCALYNVCCVYCTTCAVCIV